MTNEEILEVLTPLKKLVAQLETKLEQQTAAREAECKSRDHDWFITDFIGVDSKTVEDWNTEHFMSECQYLHAKPVMYPLHRIDVAAPRDLYVARLNNVTVTANWLKEHAVDEDSLYYQIGGHQFYIGSCKNVGTR